MSDSSSLKTNKGNYTFPLFILLLFLVFTANQYYVKQKYASYTGQTTATLINIEEVSQYSEGRKFLEYYKATYVYHVNQARYTQTTKISRIYKSEIKSLMEEPSQCVQVNYDPANPKNNFIDLEVNRHTLDCGN